MVFRFKDPRNPGKIFVWDEVQGRLSLPDGKTHLLSLDYRPGKFLLQLIKYGEVDQNADPIGLIYPPITIPRVGNVYKQLLQILGVNVKDRSERDLFISRPRGRFVFHPELFDDENKNYDAILEEPNSDIGNKSYWRYFSTLKEQGEPGVVFYLGCYPVTNALFQIFQKQGGYHRQKFWCKQGWALRQILAWEEPAFFRDTQWNRPHQPVVGISWYEATAFCRMLNEFDAFPMNRLINPWYCLPDKDHWQWAAGGENRDVYPWGHGPDEPIARLRQKANFGLSQKGTTHVKAYPNGKTKRGLYDMAGNVWEWCAKKDGMASLVAIKGGSWASEKHVLMGNSVEFESPGRRDATIGFRICMTQRPQRKRP